MLRPKEVVCKWVDAFNDHDVEAIVSLYHDNATNHQVTNEPVIGIEAIREMFTTEFTTADMTAIVENIFEDGQWAILEWRDPLGLRMGDESNDFHRNVVRPKVTELLNPNSSDYILDIACGNGNYSAYLAEKGISVVGFDYGEKMIELAKKRRKHNTDRIEFYVADATNEISMKTLKRNRMFTKAVSNMAVMDITDIKPLFTAVYNLIEDNGVFVFATQHPCFVTLTDKYMTPHSYYDIAIEGQPQKQCYYHRSLQDIFNMCFDTGFVIEQGNSRYYNC